VPDPLSPPDSRPRCRHEVEPHTGPGRQPLRLIRAFVGPGQASRPCRKRRRVSTSTQDRTTARSQAISLAAGVRRVAKSVLRTDPCSPGLFSVTGLVFHAHHRRYRYHAPPVVGENDFWNIRPSGPHRKTPAIAQDAPAELLVTGRMSPQNGKSRAKCLSQNRGTGFLTCRLTGWKAALDRLSRSHRGFGLG